MSISSTVSVGKFYFLMEKIPLLEQIHLTKAMILSEFILFRQTCQISLIFENVRKDY